MRGYNSVYSSVIVIHRLHKVVKCIKQKVNKIKLFGGIGFSMPNISCAIPQYDLHFAVVRLSTFVTFFHSIP